MKIWSLALGLLWSCCALAQSPPVRLPTTAPTQGAKKPAASKFDFHAVGVAQVVQLIYAEALKVEYVIDPEVLNDARLVSFRYDSSTGDVRAFVSAFLDSLGLAVQQRSGVDFVFKKKNDDAKAVEKEIFVYRPKYREVSYLTRLISPLFSGAFTVNRVVHSAEPPKNDKPIPSGSASSLIDQGSDTLVFSGTEREVAVLKGLLPQVDVASGEVLVRGTVYEVSTSSKDGSAFQLALTLLGGKFSLGYGGGSNLESFLRLKTTSVDAVYSALSADSRFKVVSSPSLRIRSGAPGRFSVGQEVPVLGALSFPQGSGQAVQSVEYRSSGVIFDLLPQVHDAVVDLTINQQLSNFVATQTGVNNSPTLIKREVKTSVSMQDGDVVVLGGLTENKESEGVSGFAFMPEFLRSKNSEGSKSEILLILQLNRI